jgi:hypothetical protein
MAGILYPERRFHLEGRCHKFQNPSMNFKMLVVTQITWRSFGIVIFFTPPKPSFSWFFAYSPSKSSWKASVVPPCSKHEIPFLYWTRSQETPHFRVSREVCHHQS